MKKSLFGLSLLTAGVLCADIAPFKDNERVAFLGDSITAFNHYVSDVQFAMDLSHGVKAPYFMNCGTAGDSAGPAQDRIDCDLMTMSPDRAIVMLGMNDVGYDRWRSANPSPDEVKFREDAVTNFGKNLRALVDKLLAKGVKVDLMTPSPYDQYSKDLKRESNAFCNEPGLARCAEIVRQLAAEKKLGLVELHAPMTAVEKAHPELHYSGEDRIHPNLPGNRFMAAAILAAAGEIPAADVTPAGAEKLFAVPEGSDAEKLWTALGPVRKEMERLRALVYCDRFVKGLGAKVDLADIGPAATAVEKWADGELSRCKDAARCERLRKTRIDYRGKRVQVPEFQRALETLHRETVEKWARGPVCVTPGADLAEAVKTARTRKEKVVLFAPGDYFLDSPLVFEAADSGLTLRAEKPGTACLRGDVKLTKWVSDGDGLFAVDVPGVKEGRHDTRTLIVNGVFAPRAELPGGGKRLQLTDKCTLQMRSAMEGFWDRPPTDRETRSFGYKPEDLPQGLDLSNAEVRIFHVWSESLVGIASNVVAENRIWLKKNVPPIGIWNRRDYIVYNTREGLKDPGQWYLDRTRGKVVYRPKPSEDMTKLSVSVPVLEVLLTAKDVKNMTLDGLAFTGTTPPLMRAGFAGLDLPGAVQFSGSSDGLRLENLSFFFTGGTALQVNGAPGGRVAACRFTDIGGVGARVSGDRLEFVSNRIERVGVQYPSACGASVGGEKAHVWRNTVMDGPYSGILAGGVGAVYEENRIARVMRLLSDGAAFYGGYNRCTFRNNLIEDIKTVGGGYGGNGLYNDEGGFGNLFEGNVTVDVPIPFHMHMTRGNVLRNNTFIIHGDATLSFQNSIETVFEGNRVYYGGKYRVSSPEAIAAWKDNVFFGPYGIQVEPKPAAPIEKQKTVAVGREKPGARIGLDRTEDGRHHGGSPMNGNVWWDDDALHIRFKIVHMSDESIKAGTSWGAADGVRLTVNGKTFDCFAQGEKMKGRPNYDIAADIPWREIGLEPKTGIEIPFNAQNYVSATGKYRYFDAPEHVSTFVLKGLD